MKDLKVYLLEDKITVVTNGTEVKEGKLLTANTSDGAVEKHVPVVTVKENEVTVRVGSVDHPMQEVHYIEWILLETEKGYQIHYLNPMEEPGTTFVTNEKPVAVYAYCNLHGLWKTTL